MLKTDYLGIHEEKHKRLKKAGEPGWSTEEITQANLAKVDKALQARGIKSGVLLELGCSAGNLSLLLAQKGFQAYGIDISPTAISWAKEKSREQDLDADFRVGNVLDLPYPSNFFDGIIDALCFHCIIGEDRPIFLANVFRVLKPRGLFIVMTKCGNPKEPNYLFDWTTRCSIVNGIATRYWGMPESILEEIRTAGFEVVNWKIYEYDQDQLFVEALKPLE
jgi:ubiquinone/menaquinone biosynthesis C-methylase UbiE